MAAWQDQRALRDHKPAADCGNNRDSQGETTMIRLSKSGLAVGGVVLAGGLITFMNPRAVHAV